MKKIGAITIGQAPRTDILQDIEPILGPDVVLIQAGALDTMTLDEVRSLRPDGQGNTLVSRMRDGTAVTLQEQKILPLIQQRTAGSAAISIPGSPSARMRRRNSSFSGRSSYSAPISISPAAPMAQSRYIVLMRGLPYD